MLLLSSAIAISLLLHSPFSTAPAQAGSAAEAADTAAITHVVAAYSDGWNFRDAHALAMLFTERECVDEEYSSRSTPNSACSTLAEMFWVWLILDLATALC